MDANTLDSVMKKGGKEVETGHGVVSKDGKTLTLIGKVKNAQGQEITDVSVFNRK